MLKINDVHDIIGLSVYLINTPRGIRSCTHKHEHNHTHTYTHTHTHTHTSFKKICTSHTKFYIRLNKLHQIQFIPLHILLLYKTHYFVHINTIIAQLANGMLQPSSLSLTLHCPFVHSSRLMLTKLFCALLPLPPPPFHPSKTFQTAIPYISCFSPLPFLRSGQ